MFSRGAPSVPDFSFFLFSFASGVALPLFLCPFVRPSLPPGRRSCLVLSPRWSACFCCVSFLALVGALGFSWIWGFSPVLEVVATLVDAFRFISCPCTLSTRASFQQDTFALSKSFGDESLDGKELDRRLGYFSGNALEGTFTCPAFSVSSFEFVHALVVPELLQLGCILWLSVSHFPAEVMARRHPVFLLPDCLQWLLTVERIAHAFNGQGIFFVRHSQKVEGHFLFSSRDWTVAFDVPTYPCSAEGFDLTADEMSMLDFLQPIRCS